MLSSRFPTLTLIAEGLACSRGGRPLFTDLSFHLAAGGLMTVAGPNGAGKSSLLRLLAGLIHPEAGRFRLEGESKDDGVIHYLGHADALKAALTLRETLRFWSAVYRQQGRVQLDLDFDEAAEIVGLRHTLELPVGVFSAGQRRRAALARLLLSPRPIWLLDEPTSSLDRNGEELLGSLMEKHLAAGGLIVAATHLDLRIRPTRTLKLGGDA